MFLLAVCSSFKNCLFNSFVYLFSGLLILCRISFFELLYILVINPLSEVWLAKTFFSLVTVSFSSGLFSRQHRRAVNLVFHVRWLHVFFPDVPTLPS
jgi:hypothetical protein